jgi:hypothetical protein
MSKWQNSYLPVVQALNNNNNNNNNTHNSNNNKNKNQTSNNLSSSWILYQQGLAQQVPMPLG